MSRVPQMRKKKPGTRSESLAYCGQNPAPIVEETLLGQTTYQPVQEFLRFLVALRGPINELRSVPGSPTFLRHSSLSPRKPSRGLGKKRRNKNTEYRWGDLTRRHSIKYYNEKEEQKGGEKEKKRKGI